MRGTSGNVNDVVVANSLPHAKGIVFADSGHRGARKRSDAKPGVSWQIARRPSLQALRGRVATTHWTARCWMTSFACRSSASPLASPT